MHTIPKPAQSLSPPQASEGPEIYTPSFIAPFLRQRARDPYGGLQADDSVGQGQAGLVHTQGAPLWPMTSHVTCGRLQGEGASLVFDQVEY